MRTKPNYKERIIVTSINLLLFIAMVAVNALAVILPINGKTTGELANQYPNLFVPAGLTFSIWSLIYLLLFIFFVTDLINAFPKKENKFDSLKCKHRLFIGFSCILNMFWIVLWHYEWVLLSVGVMLGLLSILIYLFLYTNALKLNSVWSYIPIQLTFSVYLGWITVATIANITAWLVHVNWYPLGLSANSWVHILIFTICIITLLIIFKRKNLAFPLVIIWALLGIILKRKSSSPVETDIIYSCGISIGIISVVVISTGLNYLKKRTLA